MDQCKKQILVINTGGGGGGGGDGDVKGPAGANDLHVAVFNGVTGKNIADGGLAVADLQTRGIPSGGTPTHVTDIESMLDHMWSAGAVAGFALTDNGNGTVNIAAGEVMLRTSATDDGQLLSMTVPAAAGLALTDHATNYICVDYNAGTPQVVVTQTLAGFNCMDVCLLHTVVREGTTLRYVDATQQNVDANRKHRRMLLETEGLRRMRGGSVLSGVAAARTIRVSAGGFYYGLAQVLHDAFDTSGASTFTTVYANGSGGWTYVPAQTQIDNAKYDDGSGTLATLTGTRYGVHWVYLALGTPCELVVQYGTGNYSGMPGALEAAVPTPPPLLQSLGVLLGRIIIRRNATELAAVDTAFDTTFTFTRLTDHEELSGLQGGDVGEHYHLTAAQHGGLPATAAPQDGGVYGVTRGRWTDVSALAPTYPAFFKDKPLKNIALPFGTTAINETIITGGSAARAVDALTIFNERTTTKVSISAGSASQIIDVGVSSATINFDFDTENLPTQARFITAVKVETGNSVANGLLYLGAGDYSAFYTFALHPMAYVDGWTILVGPNFGYDSATGTPNLDAALRGKLRLVMTSGITVGNIWFSPVYALPPAKKSVVLTFDDGYSEHLWLATKAANRGIPVSFSIPKDNIGTAGFLTVGDMLGIHSTHGDLIEFTNHAKNNTSYTPASLESYVDAVVECRTYLAGLGLPYDPASLHAYVQGQFDQDLIDELRALGFLSCREVGASNRYARNIAIAAEGASSDWLYKIPASCNLGTGQDLATVKSYINNTAGLGTAFVMGHRLAATAGTIQWIKGYDDTYGILNLLDWLAHERDSGRMELLKWSDWYKRTVRSKLPLLL